MRTLVLLFFCLVSLLSFGQQSEYSFQEIPIPLLESSNSVVRYEMHKVNIPNQSSITIHHKRVITVLNKKGDAHTRPYVYYDDVTRVKSLKVKIYDKAGIEISDFKKRDFKDVSAVDGISLYTDTRLLYLNYTPTTYPYTMVLESETTSKNTMAIPSFYVNDEYYSSTQEKFLEIVCAAELGLRYKAFGKTDNLKIEQTSGSLKVSVENAVSISPEKYSPGFREIVGHVAIALDAFHLEGVDGNSEDWKTFGKWLNDNLLQEANDLPEETIASVKALVSEVQDPIEKARIIYNYVQDKTRYVSVQVGIGGWKPMKASQVDKLGYGDCKALSSYTQSLLSAVGIPSYYTILYGGFEKRDIIPDFAGIQGNHAILTIPDGDDYIWLECTNQTVPFGFIAGFTDDRDVLVVKPEGGEIVHTKRYEPQENFQSMKGECILDSSGNIKASVLIKSGGLQYGDRYNLIQQDEDDRKDHYYKFWDYLNNVKLENISVENNRNDVVFSEDIDLEVDSYASFAGDEMLVPINVLNRYTNLPNKVNDRRLPVSISRGFSDVDDIKISIPEGFEIVSLPEGTKIESPFGQYSFQLDEDTSGSISYKRKFILLEGDYTNDQYKEFRKFIRQVIRSDKQKLVIRKI